MATPLPLNIPADERGDKDDDYVDSGALLPLDKADGTPSGSIQLLGIRTVILSLVMCMGRVIADGTSPSIALLIHRPPTLSTQATPLISRYHPPVHLA
jgi:hypothetical protein